MSDRAKRTRTVSRVTFDIPRCLRCLGELEPLIAGSRCRNPKCARVLVDVVGSESGIAARWVQP